jgi:hypothetical protein
MHTIKHRVRLSKALSLGGTPVTLRLGREAIAMDRIPKDIPNPDWTVFKKTEGQCPDTAMNSEWALTGGCGYRRGG